MPKFEEIDKYGDIGHKHKSICCWFCDKELRFFTDIYEGKKFCSRKCRYTYLAMLSIKKMADLYERRC